MSDKQIELPAKTTAFDIIRYVLVAVIVVGGIWYYFFNTPIILTSQETAGKTMGTVYMVKVAGFPETNDWKKIADAIQAQLDVIDSAMSAYQNDSEVCRFNAFQSTEDWFPVSKETAEVVKLALEISAQTEGAFDITVAPLVNLWGFGPVKSNLPLDELRAESARLRERVGYEKLTVRLDSPSLKKSIPELTIDLSAIAKGYAVDRIAQLLEENKIGNYMIEVGGEVRCRGNKEKQGNWAIGIEKPVIEFAGLQRKLTLTDQSLATSGDYRQRRKIGNVEVSHFIDPRTGLPTEQIERDAADNEVLGSVSVTDKSCAKADALATALTVLGEQKGLAFADKHGIATLFLLRNGAAIREAASKAFP